MVDCQFVEEEKKLAADNAQHRSDADHYKVKYKTVQALVKAVQDKVQVDGIEKADFIAYKNELEEISRALQDDDIETGRALSGQRRADASGK